MSAGADEPALIFFDSRQLAHTTMKIRILLSLIFVLSSAHANFSDNFTAGTSSSYTGSNSFGGGGTFTVNTATGTLDVQAASGNTYAVMLDDQTNFLEAGEYFEAVSTVGVGSSAPHQFVVVSNTPEQPSASTGFRFRRSPSLRIWGGDAPGSSTTLADPGNSGGLSYRIERVSATEFRFLYNTGLGFQDLGTYNLPGAATQMHVGVQSWAGTTPWDSFEIGTLVTTPNEAPTDIQLSNDTVRDNQPAGAAVGQLSAVDANIGDTHIFSVLSVDGSTTSTLFTVSGNELVTGTVLPATPTSYAVEIEAEDSGALTFSKTVTVNVVAPLAVFGAMADVQYADIPSAGSRDYRGSINRLQAAVNFYNTQELDFVIHLGDFIQQYWESYDDLMPIWEQLNAPATYHVLGNHEFDQIGVENIDQVDERLGMPAPYHTFTVPGTEADFLFIVIDGQEFATFTTLAGTPERAYADQLRATASSRGSNGVTWNGGVGPIQFAWLRDQLDGATAAGQKVIIMCHYPIMPLGATHNNHTDYELKALIDEYPAVKAWMNGHNHAGRYTLADGVHHYTMRGIVEQAGSNAYAVVELYEDRMVVDGFFNEPDRTFIFSENETGLAPVSNLQAAVDGSEIELTWSDTNSGETGYLIQRRSLGDSAYTTLATTAADTTSYTDTSLLADTYRYRVAAVDNDDTGPWEAFVDAEVEAPTGGGTPFTLMFMQGQEITLDDDPTGTVYDGIEDTRLRASTPTTNYGNDTADHEIDTSSAKHTVIKFKDILDMIPAGAFIESATLSIDISNDGDDMSLNRLGLSAIWDESTATWSNFGATANDGITALDLEGSPTAVSGSSGVQEIDVTEDITAWVSGAPNNGWAFLPGGTDNVRFGTSENSDTARRPKLTLTYSIEVPVIPEPALIMPLLALGSLLIASRRNQF